MGLEEDIRFEQESALLRALIDNHERGDEIRRELGEDSANWFNPLPVLDRLGIWEEEFKKGAAKVAV